MKRFPHFRLIARLAVAVTCVLISSCARPAGAPAEIPDLIRVVTPKPRAIVTSPLRVTGEARGRWYFEASFPVRLLAADGHELARTSARARGDWMTADFVPFEAVLEFHSPGSGAGTLVLEKDNPSGLPENAGELRIPVKF